MIGSFASDKYVYENPITEVHQHDFLTQDQPYWTACMGIITNPPYRNNGAELFVRRAMKFNSPFTAILCRGTFFESAQRLNFFKYNPPSRILFFSRRFSCNEEYFVKEPLSGMVAYAWWIWNGQTRHGETKCSWIDTESVYNEWLQSCYLTGDDISKFITEKTKSRTIGLEAFLGTEPDAVEP